MEKKKVSRVVRFLAIADHLELQLQTQFEYFFFFFVVLLECDVFLIP